MQGNTYIKEVCKVIEEFAPLSLQENYDNAGLIVGDPQALLDGILITLDVTESTIDEAIQKGLNLIVSHHPIIFKGLKKITGKTPVERCVIKAIKNNIAIYAAHTNIDSVRLGVSKALADQLKLEEQKVLSPKPHVLMKLVTFVPKTHTHEVREALAMAGAGAIGNYTSCSYIQEGSGFFKAQEGANPTVGTPGELHQEAEMRLEVLVPTYLQHQVVAALLHAHPYETPAYDLYPLNNTSEEVGYGMMGILKNPMSELEFLAYLKGTIGVEVIKHSALRGKKIHKVALSGGSGAFLIDEAIRSKADVFISSEFKYNEYNDVADEIILADIGHFESEQFTKQVFLGILQKKFSKFALCFAETSLNPVKYYK